MSRSRLTQLSQLARNTARSLTPVIQLSQLQSPPTLLRTRSRQWFGSAGSLARDFAEKSVAWTRRAGN